MMALINSWASGSVSGGGYRGKEWKLAEGGVAHEFGVAVIRPPEPREWEEESWKEWSSGVEGHKRSHNQGRVNKKPVEGTRT